VDEYKQDYLKKTNTRKEKGTIVHQVRCHLKQEGYRFVQRQGDIWVQADEAAERKKVVQALREGAPDLRNQQRKGNNATGETTNEWPCSSLHEEQQDGVASVISMDDIDTDDPLLEFLLDDETHPLAETSNDNSAVDNMIPYDPSTELDGYDTDHDDVLPLYEVAEFLADVFDEEVSLLLSN
jgi:hypothetical protein